MKAEDVNNYIEMVDGNCLYGHVGLGGIARLTQSSINILNKIIDLAKVISDVNGGKYIWLTADGDNNSKEFFLIKLDFETAIYINDTLMGDTKRNGVGVSNVYDYDFDFTVLFDWILNGVANVIDMLHKGTYEEYILKELPARCRSGVIKLSKYWEYYPEHKEQIYRHYDLNVLSDFMKWFDDNKDSLKGYEEMTPSLFYEACYFIYKYNGVDVEGLTPKEAYLRYSDGRDMGFFKLPDDYNALEKWIERCGCGDHASEIGCATMWFHRNSASKWVFFVLSSKDKNYHENRMELVLNMAKAGFHIDTNYYSGEVMKLRGECNVALEPQNRAFDYMQTYDADIIAREKIRFCPEPFPKGFEDVVQWLRPHICQLKE